MPNETKKDWTIMIYMAGDNNLSIDMAYALQQIKEVVRVSNDNVNLFVYYDGYSPAIPTLYCDFSDAQNPYKFFRSYKVKDKLYPVEKSFDENSAAARSVINFVDWCVNKVEYEENGQTFKGRKADKHALIFSGHTLGFQSIGLLKDENSNYYMTLRKINWLLERITQPKTELEEKAQKKRDRDKEKWDDEKWACETNEIIGKKLDILGFDSCVMSMLEVGYQFNAVAETMIASEGSIPNAGWTYAQILGNLANTRKDTSTNKVAKNFVEDFILRQDRYTLGGVSVDMAAWDLSALTNIEEPFENFADSLTKCFEDKNSTIYKQMRRVLLQVHWKTQSYMLEQNIDLGDFCELLIEEINSLKEEFNGQSFDLLDIVCDCCQALLTQLQKCIILSGFSGGKYQYSNGISLFFPWSLSGYDVSRKNYEDLNFIEKTTAGKKWNEFLFKYLSEVSFRQAKPITSKGDKEKTYYSYVFKDDLHQGDVPAQSSSSSYAAIIGVNGGTVKIPENGTNKIPENGTNKIPENGTNKIPENGTNKIPENGTNKIPENGSNRIFGSLGLFFDEFINFKNIQTPWNLSGFTEVDKELDDRVKNNTEGHILFR